MAGNKNTAHSIVLSLAYVVLGMTIIGTFATGLRAWQFYNDLKQEQQNNLLAFATFKSQAVEEYLENLKNIAISVTDKAKIMPNYQEDRAGLKQTIKVVKNLKNNNTKQTIFFQIEDLLKKYPEIAGIREYNSSNKLIAQIGLTATDTSANSEGLTWIENKPYWLVKVPVLDKKSQVVGTKVVLFKLDRLNQILEKGAGENKIKTALFSQESRSLIFPFKPIPKQTTLDKNSPLVIALKNGKSETKGIRKIDGPFKIIAYTSISGSKWYLIAWNDVKKNASSPLEINFIWHLVIVGPGTLILIGLGVTSIIVLWRQFNKTSQNLELTPKKNKGNYESEEAQNFTIKNQENLTNKTKYNIPVQRSKKSPTLTEVWRAEVAGEGGEIFGLWDWNLQTNEIYFSLPRQNGNPYTDNEIGNHPDEWFKRVHPDDIERLKAQLSVHFAGLTPYFCNEHRILDKNGSYRWMLARGVAWGDSNGKPHTIAGSISDISDKKAAEEENKRLAAFPRNDPNPVLAADKRGNVIYLNPAAKQILKKLDLNDPMQLLPTNHYSIVDNCLSSLASERHIERNIKDCIFSWSYHPIPSLGVIHLYGSDITERQWAQEQLEQAAWHDGLTGLPNRTLFINRVEQAITQAKQRSNGLFALLFLDLDRFKVVNDSLGHSLGDQFLVAVARRLSSCVRPGDVVARLGGDEFTILLSSISNIDGATAFAERIQQELAMPVNLNGHQVFTSASIGIAAAAYGHIVTGTDDKNSDQSLWGRPYLQPEDLLRDADIAMYHAKAEGKARYVVFTQAMHERAIVLLSLENDLRRAISETGFTRPEGSSLESSLSVLASSFVLHYQPLIALDTGRIAGFEALVRWVHPQRGIVSPAEFIPVAEETGLIIPLGTWVLYEACRQLKAWQERFRSVHNLTMSVNLSGRQLSQTNLLSQIDEILECTGIEPSCLKLEITESVLMDNAATSISTLEELRSRNIGLCIDDFGTGYSSLSYLHRFPINTLKIDRSFVNEMGGDDENSEIVRAIVMLAHNLGMYVVAEGVETEKHLVQLWALQCEYGQGYFFSKPVSAADAELLMADAPQW
ncbi:MAG TPA: EAL domain-containing protein [Halomicronema sp.]